MRAGDTLRLLRRASGAGSIRGKGPAPEGRFFDLVRGILAFSGAGLTMLGVKLIDSTLVVVLHNGEQEIERKLATSADALRVALMMLARRGRLEIGDVLKVEAPG